MKHARCGTASEIGFYDAWVALDFSGCSFGDLGAVVKYDDLVADTHDDMHIMFDEQDGDVQLLTQTRMKCIISVVSLWIHPGGRFIQQEQSGLTGKCAGDFQSALGTVGQVASQLVAQIVQTDKVQEVGGLSRLPLSLL